MGENVLAFWEWFKTAFLLSKVYHKLIGFLDLIPQSVKDFYYENRILCYMVAIAGLILLAFEGYKLFRFGLYVLFGAGGGYAAYYFLGPILEKVLGDKIPTIVDIKVILGFVVGLIFVALNFFLYKGVVMILGGICGFLFGYIYVWRVAVANFGTLQFLQTDTFRILVGLVFAFLVGLIFLGILKYVVLIGSSFGCMAFAAYLASKILVPGGNASVKICFIILGIAVAVFACVHQFRDEESRVQLV